MVLLSTNYFTYQDISELYNVLVQIRFAESETKFDV